MSNLSNTGKTGFHPGREKELLEGFEQRNEVIYLAYITKRITLSVELGIISKGSYQLSVTR